MEYCMMPPNTFLDGVLLCGALALFVWTAIVSVRVAFLSMEQKSPEEELDALRRELALREERERALRQVGKKHEAQSAEEDKRIWQ